MIGTVGVLNGIGWSLLQNWMWADEFWPNVTFNWWRCWETSGGISIGLSYGVAYYLVNRRVTDSERTTLGPQLTNQRPNLERFGAYFGLLLGLGLSIRNGWKGWGKLYFGDEDYWSKLTWRIVGPVMLASLTAIVIRILWRRLPRGYEGDMFPHAFALMWLVLITQNVIAQLVTGPKTNLSEGVFSVYYAALFVLTGTIVYLRRTRTKALVP